MGRIGLIKYLDLWKDHWHWHRRSQINEWIRIKALKSQRTEVVSAGDWGGGRSETLPICVKSLLTSSTEIKV